MKSKVIDRDLGWKAAMEHVKALVGHQYAKVGVLADDPKGEREIQGGGMTEAQLATVLEFGTEDKKIPSRPFLRSTFDAKTQELKDDSAILLGQILYGRQTVKGALSILGLKLATEIKKTITTGAGVPPPNAPGYADEKLVKGSGKKKYGLEKGSFWLGEKSQAYNKKTGQNVDAQYLVRPLVDTGRLLNSITYALVMNGAGEK